MLRSSVPRSPGARCCRSALIRSRGAWLRSLPRSQVPAARAVAAQRHLVGPCPGPLLALPLLLLLPVALRRFRSRAPSWPPPWYDVTESVTRGANASNCRAPCERVTPAPRPPQPSPATPGRDQRDPPRRSPRRLRCPAPARRARPPPPPLAAPPRERSVSPLLVWCGPRIARCGVVRIGHVCSASIAAMLASCIASGTAAIDSAAQLDLSRPFRCSRRPPRPVTYDAARPCTAPRTPTWPRTAARGVLNELAMSRARLPDAGASPTSCAVFGSIPGVLYAAGRARSSASRPCDDRGVAAHTPSTTKRDPLLDVVRLGSIRSRLARAVAFARPSSSRAAAGGARSAPDAAA